MFYRLQRVSLGSALRLGLLLGWLAALLPALVLAWLMVQLVGGVNMLLGQMTPYELSLLGQRVTSLDPLSFLGLADFALQISALADLGGMLFVLLSLALTLLGGLGVALTSVLVALVYNLVAAMGGGLKLELRAEQRALRQGNHTATE
jgi:hypothetical protein